MTIVPSVARLVLFDNPVSSNALKVRFLLAELDLEHERREVPMARPRPGWYLAVNPLGGIPAIDDDGFALAESHAILRYLARRQARADLYPAAAGEQARVDEFLDRFHTTLPAGVLPPRGPRPGLRARRGGLRRGAARPRARRRGRGRRSSPPCGCSTRSVSPSAAVLGRFTIADCALAPVLFRTARTGLDLTPHPTLHALREALVARPAFARADPVG